MKRVEKFKKAVKDNKYKSFTNAKKHNLVNWFVDGKDYFADLHDSLLAAKQTVYITDWWLSPEVFLLRPVETGEYSEMKAQKKNAKEYEPYSRLMDVLNHIAEKGVQVFVLVYCEMSLALTLNSKHSKKALVDMNSNIKVVRHPKDSFDLLWSHHEKLVVIDQTIGYVGGLDLCWGRYDTNDHPIYESPNADNNYLFPGIDYSNSRICDFTNVENYLKESVDRKVKPRMPWHDVHIKIEGPVVADIARHFVQRWNFSKYGNSEAITSVKGNASVYRGVKKATWLGGIIQKTNKKEKEEKKKEEKTEEISTEKAKPKSKAKNKKKMLLVGFSGLAKKKDEGVELEEKKEEDVEHEEKKEENVEHEEKKEEGAKATEVTESELLEKKQIEGKVVLDEDHLMLKTGDAKLVKPAGKVSIYKSFVGGLAKVGKKKFDFFKRKEDYLLKYRGFFGSFKPGLKSECQVLRSGSLWSVGIQQTENSILQGYYNLIDNAKHYIYIENQFFISKSFSEEERKSCKNKPSNIVENEIAYHIRKRIELAYSKKEKFHVFVFIPLLPGFAGEPESSGTLQIILKHTYASISHNYGLSLIEKLKEKMGDEVHNYISFFSLRGHTTINDIPVTELIYIHSKLMIVDDEEFLIGSANINDRSMLGKRDSEFAVIVREEKTYNSTMNGKGVKVAKNAITFRKQLMAEHLGLKPTDKILNDPLNEDFLKLIKERAKNNTFIYRELFGCYPDDIYTTFATLRKRKMPVTEEDYKQLKLNYSQKKDSIIGHIVEFPLHFLCEEKLGINFFSVENLVPERNFT